MEALLRVLFVTGRWPRSQTYRVPMEASESLATCLLASLEPVLVAPVEIGVSETCSTVEKRREYWGKGEVVLLTESAT